MKKNNSKNYFFRNLCAFPSHRRAQGMHSELTRAQTLRLLQSFARKRQKEKILPYFYLFLLVNCLEAPNTPANTGCGNPWLAKSHS